MQKSTRRTSSFTNNEPSYHPFAIQYTKKDGTPAQCNVFCGLTTKDFILILGCYVGFYSSLFGISALLLNGVIETNEKNSLLWSFLAVGILFSVGLFGAIVMSTRSLQTRLGKQQKSNNDVELNRDEADLEHQ